MTVLPDPYLPSISRRPIYAARFLDPGMFAASTDSHSTPVRTHEYADQESGKCITNNWQNPSLLESTFLHTVQGGKAISHEML